MTNKPMSAEEPLRKFIDFLFEEGVKEGKEAAAQVQQAANVTDLDWKQTNGGWKYGPFFVSKQTDGKYIVTALFVADGREGHEDNFAITVAQDILDFKDAMEEAEHAHYCICTSLAAPPDALAERDAQIERLVGRLATLERALHDALEDIPEMKGSLDGQHVRNWIGLMEGRFASALYAAHKGGR